MNEIAKEWVDKAESDFDAADLTLHGREAPIAVLIRYPGLVVPAKMAEQAFESAGRIRDFMKEKLGISN